MNYKKMSIITKFGSLKTEEERERETGEGVALPFVVDNFLSLDGGEMRETLNMGNKQIINIADPVNPQDVATKNYVDKAGGHRFFTKNRDGDFIASENLKMGGKQIQDLPLPVEDQDAVTKIYADTLVEQRRRNLEANNPFSLQNGKHTAKDSLNMKNFKIENVGDAENEQDVVNVKYFNENSGFLRRNGGFEAQDHIYLKGKKLGGIRDPKADGEATNKKYVDDENEKTLLLLYKSNMKDLINAVLNETKQKIDKGGFNPTVGHLSYELILKEKIENEIKNYVDKNINDEDLKKLVYKFQKTVSLDLLKKFRLLDSRIENDPEKLAKFLKEKIEEFKIENKIFDPAFLRLNGHFEAVGDIDMKKK